jgi:hypothetical protein
MAMEGTGETDSLAEREEFEPSVAFERMVNFAKEPYGGYKESSIGREFSLEQPATMFVSPAPPSALIHGPMYLPPMALSADFPAIAPLRNQSSPTQLARDDNQISASG